MEAGYQRQLSYMRGDGSFSAFGDNDASGSTWLTAFVVKSFAQAKPHIYIDRDVLVRASNYLIRQIDLIEDRGSAIERGAVHNKALMGGDHGSPKTGKITMTAYVLGALLRSQELEVIQNNEVIPAMITYVASNLDTIKNNSYALSIATHALQLAKAPAADQFFQALDQRGVDVEEDGFRSWNYTKPGQSSRPWYWYRPSSLDVEATAYALLAYLNKGGDYLRRAAPVAKWLVRQQNGYGGYSSTQDTVMAIQALGQYAEKTYDPDTSLRVSWEIDGKMDEGFTVDSRNAIVLQQKDVSFQFHSLLKKN